ncbi:hypothetical protein Clacol_001675 [Clathrus columnatus]|uniref:Origin recognition complex subunit 4 C-terminal domain-containing protein n=1 Tax=Clathrus columnatus TaxID=1419009 RepID=A0AAV5A1W1_9AGAM|nr:hypothetical protein Clacol_001675 [Clathrus columnatus]
MSKRQLSTPERRATRSSGILEPIQQLSFTSKKRKKESQEIETSSSIVTSQHETVTPNLNKDIPLPAHLPNHLIPYLQVQKRAVIYALTRLNFVEPVLFSETKAFQELKQLIQGTIDRQEVIRLSGHSQTNDRLAMREIVRQIREQSGTDVFIDPKGEDSVQDDNDTNFPGEADLSLPPSSRLPQLISSLPSLGQPVVIILDAFDKFTEHTRQALLYCLLDTVQSCRGTLADSHPRDQSSSDPPDSTNKRAPTSTRNESGLLVVGITSRVDCVTLLEKRVKIIFELFKTILTTDPGLDHLVSSGWQTMWSKSIENILISKFSILDTGFLFQPRSGYSIVFSLTGTNTLIFPGKSVDFKQLSCLTALSPDSPWLTPTLLRENTVVQRCSTQHLFLRGLPYPHLSLLIAAMHTSVAGQEMFTFEMLYDKFTAQVRLTASAPVDSERGSINMPFIPRNILLGAFEDLIDNHVFCPAIPYASHISKEFMKYRSLATREDIKTTVDGIGQTAIKKWFYRNQ